MKTNIVFFIFIFYSFVVSAQPGIDYTQIAKKTPIQTISISGANSELVLYQGINIHQLYLKTGSFYEKIEIPDAFSGRKKLRIKTGANRETFVIKQGQKIAIYRFSTKSWYVPEISGHDNEKELRE